MDQKELVYQMTPQSIGYPANFEFFIPKELEIEAFRPYKRGDLAWLTQSGEVIVDEYPLTGFAAIPVIILKRKSVLTSHMETK